MEAPGDLRARGLLFWEEVTEAVNLDASGFVLLGEACRIVDRLDRLSDALNGQGRDWLKIADEVEDYTTDSGHRKVTVRVVVDGLLSEGRQQQLAFKSVMAQMNLGKATEKLTGEKSAIQEWLENRGRTG